MHVLVVESMHSHERAARALWCTLLFQIFPSFVTSSSRAARSFPWSLGVLSLLAVVEVSVVHVLVFCRRDVDHEVFLAPDDAGVGG